MPVQQALCLAAAVRASTAPRTFQVPHTFQVAIPAQADVCRLSNPECASAEVEHLGHEGQALGCPPVVKRVLNFSEALNSCPGVLVENAL